MAAGTPKPNDGAFDHAQATCSKEARIKAFKKANVSCSLVLLRCRFVPFAGCVLAFAQRRLVSLNGPGSTHETCCIGRQGAGQTKFCLQLPFLLIVRLT